MERWRHEGRARGFEVEPTATLHLVKPSVAGVVVGPELAQVSLVEDTVAYPPLECDSNEREALALIVDLERLVILPNGSDDDALVSK